MKSDRNLSDMWRSPFNIGPAQLCSVNSTQLSTLMINVLPSTPLIQKCISEVIEWNTISKLVCNPSKTEVIQFKTFLFRNNY